jgi:hypothetical protein
LTAIVTSSEGVTPTGTITFLDGGADLGTAPLDRFGIVTLTMPSLAPGDHSFTADYSGDTDLTSAASKALSALVVRDGTLVTVVPMGSRRMKGLLRELAVEVIPLAPGAGVPTGTVEFSAVHVKGVERYGKSERGTKLVPLGTSTLNDGTAMLSLLQKRREVRGHLIQIEYDGDGDFLSSSATVRGKT